MTDKEIQKLIKSKKSHISQDDLNIILNSIQVTGYEITGKAKSFELIKINLNTGEHFKAMLVVGGEDETKV